MKIKLQNAEKYLKEKLKNSKFKEAYDLERAKVAIAQKIAESRQAHNLKQSELARKMHVSQQFISQIESGNARNLTLSTLNTLARSLGMAIEITFSKKTTHKTCLKIA